MDSLQTNFYLDHEACADEAPPPVLCDMYDEGNRQHAAHACQQCLLRMCRSCRRHHDMIARDHDMTPVSHGQPVKERSKTKSLCLIHQDQDLCFHCRQCDVSICPHCKLTSHEGHVTVELASTALEAKEEVTSLVATAQKQVCVCVCVCARACLPACLKLLCRKGKTQGVECFGNFLSLVYLLHTLFILYSLEICY